jgi:hypothetical protein
LSRGGDAEAEASHGSGGLQGTCVAFNLFGRKGLWQPQQNRSTSSMRPVLRLENWKKRETGFELATSTLATWCSTTELLPRLAFRITANPLRAGNVTSPRTAGQPSSEALRCGGVYIGQAGLQPYPWVAEKRVSQQVRPPLFGCVPGRGATATQLKTRSGRRDGPTVPVTRSPSFRPVSGADCSHRCVAPILMTFVSAEAEFRGSL